jgi:hypothetical protein
VGNRTSLCLQQLVELVGSRRSVIKGDLADKDLVGCVVRVEVLAMDQKKDDERQQVENQPHERSYDLGPDFIRVVKNWDHFATDGEQDDRSRNVE